jgi:hypothetical protein
MTPRKLAITLLAIILGGCASMGIQSYWHPCRACPPSFECNAMSGRCEARTEIQTHYGQRGGDVP